MFNGLKKLLKKIKDLNVSVDKYKKETENQSLPSVAYVNRAKKLMNKENYADAEKILLQALNINPKDAIIYKYLGICEEKMCSYEKACDYYKQSAKSNPQDKEIWYKLGMSEIILQRFEEAEISFEKADKVTPMNTDINTGWGMSLLKQKKYSQAYEKFSSALKINHYNFSAMLFAAIMEIRLNRYDDAERKLRFLMDANPTEGAAFEYANLYFTKGDLDGAIRYAQKSVELNPNMLPAYLLLGKVYSLKFDYDKSMLYFSTARDRNLISPLLYVEWGNALLNFYRFYEAKEMFEKAPEDAKSQLNLCKAQLGEPVEELSDDIYSFEAKGILSDDPETAIDYFKKALQLNPNEIYNYLRLAKCYEKLNKVDMVKDCYDKFIKQNPNYPTAYFDYANFLIGQNDFKSAQRKLRKAEKLSPEDAKILNLLFYVTYRLVKDDVCEYNIKEAISIADRIKYFEYPELKSDLERLLNK